MDPDARRRFRRLQDLFHEISELPAEERPQRLEQVRAQSADLHAELVDLLRDAEAETSGIEAALEELAERPALAGESSLRPGETVGPYRLMRLLGEGGMGRVYEAEQSEPLVRRVALKIMRHVEARSILERFDAERQALAVMDHPHIARMLDAGSTADGRPWFAMELVEGESVTRWADRHELDLEARLQLVLPVCDAIQHAHSKGVIHRDLKPSNILVARGEDGEPTPKVIDFGIAKAIEQPLLARTLATQLGELVGTPEYMSPEQATLGAVDIDTRSDVYALGLVLYELLVGELPLPAERLRGLAFDEICRRIREDETPRPSARLTTTTGHRPIRRLRGELDAVLLKALSKDRDRRYESAAAFARDLRRLLADEPVEAAPPSFAYRASKMIRRHRLAFALGALAVVSLLAGLAAATVGLLEARRAEKAAVAARDETARALRTSEETTDFVLRLFQASNPQENPGLELTARELLERGAQRVYELEDEPGVQAQLLEMLGRVSWSLGAFDRAEALYEESLEVRRKVPDAVMESQSWTRLGDIRRERAELERAEDAYRRAIERLEAAGLGRSAAMASALNSLGILYSRLHRLEEAAPLLERALAISEELGEEPLGVAAALSNLGSVYLRSGDAAKALETSRRAYDLFAAELPPNHPNLAVLSSNISLSARSLGRLGTALASSRKALEIDRQTLPQQHPGIASGLHGLGGAAQRLGLFEEARAAFEEALAILDAAHGPGHFSGTLHRASLGSLALAEGDPAAAVDWLAPVVAELEASDDPRAPRHLVGYRRQLAVAHRRLGRLEQARAGARRVAEIIESLEQRDELAPTRLLQAMLSWQVGENERAEALFAAALELSGCDLGAHCSLDNSTTYVLRAHWHAARGETDDAFRTLQRALEHPGWSASLLDAPELERLPRDHRWQSIRSKLESKLETASEAMR